jgi:hypothetical protein
LRIERSIGPRSAKFGEIGVRDQEAECYNLKLEGHGISVSREISQEAARAILDVVFGGDRAGGGGRSEWRGKEALDDRDDGNRPSMSLPEFLDASGAKRNPDKIAVIGQYIVEFEGRQDFSREDVKVRFRQAGEGVPSNFPRDFTWAVKNGWIAEDLETKGAYYVTRKGKEAVERKFATDIVKKTAQKKSSVRRRSKTDETEAGRGA